jgi:hypothetical protein
MSRSIARARRARRTRGAMLVEALIVIACLTLGLVGVIYFRELYLSKLGVQQLARASVIAHSMVGCKGSEPRQWLGRDARPYTIANPGQSRQTAQDPKAPAEPGRTGGEGSRSTGLLGKAGGTTSDGKGMLNPITDVRMSGNAAASTGSGGGTKFQGTLNSQSFVSCAEQVRQDDYGAIVGVIKEDLVGFVSGG